MYSVPEYLWMVTDPVRVDAYARALRAAITPQSFVIEIGTGIGVFAVMARQMGARRVVAIEPSDAIAVARQIAKDNGCPDIEFIQALARSVSFSERADIVVSDLRGVLPVFNGHLESVIDARERLLAPGGVLIPVADTLFAAVVEMPERHRKRTPSFSAGGAVKLDAVRRFITNTWEKAHVETEELLTTPAPWARIDYEGVTSADVAGATRLTVERGGTGHGVAVWFDAMLGEGVTFSNAPGQPELVYGTAVFPWPEPVDLHPGDEICIRIDARHVGDDYVWRWDSEVRTGDSPSTTKAHFHQSTFHGHPLVPRKLAKGSAAGTTVLNEEGQLQAFLLRSMDGTATNHDIAQRLMEQFPHTFKGFNQALARVGSVARGFGRD